MVTRASRNRLIRWGARSAAGPSFVAGAVLVALALVLVVRVMERFA